MSETKKKKVKKKKFKSIDELRKHVKEKGWDN